MNNVEVLHNGENAVRGPVDPVTAVVIDKAYTNNADGLRNLSVSDPKDFYPAAKLPLGPAEPNPTNPTTTQYPSPRDEPLDDNPEPGDDDHNAVRQSGFENDFRMVYLQRLANPLLPWDADTNPYRTIDSMSVNLMVFNGIEVEGDTPGARFSAKERGQSPLDAATNNLWSHENEGHHAKQPSVSPIPLAPPSQVLDFQIQHSLGFLNSEYHPDNVIDSLVQSTNNPSEPFPWLTWNNRPFVSQYELMLVPASSSSRLFYDFTLTPTPTVEPYDATGNDFAKSRAPFGHLLNFFKTAKTPSPGASDSDAGELASHYYRLFEYTHVPSRFVGTETLLNPGAAAFGDSTAAQTAGFRPPFN